MTRKEVKEMLPVFQAYAEGKEIESLVNGKYYRVLEICNGMNPKDYRIKPEPKYRPFKDAEECLKEMLKHQPFGWVKCKGDGSLGLITLIINEESIYINSIGSNSERTMREFTFADGTPFGILEEE